MPGRPRTRWSRVPYHVGWRRIGTVTSDTGGQFTCGVRRGRGSRSPSRAAKLGARARRRMFGIPEWAVGVGFVMLVISVAKALRGRIGPPDRLGRPRASRRDLGQAVADPPQRGGGGGGRERRAGAARDGRR